MKKKLIAVLLSLAMATSVVPEAMIFAADNTVAETENTLLTDSDYEVTDLGGESVEGTEENLTVGSEEAAVDTDAAEELEVLDEAEVAIDAEVQNDAEVQSDAEISAEPETVADAEVTAEGETEAAEEEGIFSDEVYKYRKISETEAVVAGFVSEDLTTISIPESVNDGEAAFAVIGVEKDALSGLTAETLEIPAGIIEFGGQALPGLKNITVSEENAVLYTQDGVLFAKTDVEDKNTLVLYPAAAEAESYIVPEKTAVIGEEAFANAANLKTLVIGEGVEKIASYAVKTAANAMEIAFAFTTVPTEIGEKAFYLDGANGNVLYFASEEEYKAVSEVQAAFADSSAMYDENGELIEDTAAVISIVTDGIPERIQALIDAALGEEEKVEEEQTETTEKAEPDDSSVAESEVVKVPDDSSVSEVLKDDTVAEEAVVAASPKELDANIAAGYYSIGNQAVNKFVKIRKASIKESSDSYLASYSIDMGALFNIVPLGDGAYKIVATCSNKALTLGGTVGEGVSVVQKSYTGATNQQWYIRESSSGYYKIYSAANDEYVIDTKGHGTASETVIVVSKEGTSKTQNWKLTTRTNPTESKLANGIYTIKSSLATSRVLDINGASKSSGANVQIYASNNTNAQRFILRYLGYGNLYRIINVASNKALDTTNHKTGNGANVQQTTQSSSASTQIWRILKTSDGNYAVLNAGADRALDVQNASTSNGTNVQIYQWNNSKAQKWVFSKVSGTAAVDVNGKDAELKAGWYKLSTARTTRNIAIKNSSLSNNADVLLENPGLGEKTYFYIEPVGGGRYEIRSFCSDKILTNVWGGDSSDAGKVVQREDNNYSTQRWYIRVSKRNKKFYSIVSSSDQNYVLSMKGNNAKWGTLVTTALSTGVNGQRWKITAISNPTLSVPYDGATYKIQAASNSKIVLSTEAQSKKNQANVQLMKKVNGAGEFWNFEKVGYGNLYRITNAYTGLSLDCKNGGTSNGTNIWQYTANNSAAQLWRIMPTDSSKKTFVILNASSGKALDVVGASIAAGTNIQLYAQNGTAAQNWTFSRANINTYIPVGTTVTLRQKGNKNRLIEVKDGSTTDGATVQVYAERGNTDQSFIFVKKAANVYKIRNAASNKYLDIKSTAEKAAVISTAAKDTDSQLWKIMPTGDNDASFYIVNMKTGYALTSAYANNTKVITRSYNKAKIQKFYFDTPNIKTGWQQVGSNWRYYDGKGNAYRNSFLENGKYYFDKNGNVLTGWKKYGAYYYYFKGKNGREYTDNRPYLGSLFGTTTGKYNSQTRPNCSYYYTIDTARCVVTWYTKYPGTNDWNLPVVAFLCSPGTDNNQTDPGERLTGYSLRWIPLMGNSWGQYGTEVKTWVSGYGHINTGEYFHSVACGAANTYNLNPNVYNLLGTKQSHGCIRLGVRNAYWVYNFVNAGTYGVCRSNLSAPINTLPQPLATSNVDPTDPNYTGNWAYTDTRATAYAVPGYIPRG